MTKNQPRATTSEDRRSEDAKSMVRVKDCERKARRKAEMTSEELEEAKSKKKDYDMKRKERKTEAELEEERVKKKDYDGKRKENFEFLK